MMKFTNLNVPGNRSINGDRGADSITLSFTPGGTISGNLNIGTGLGTDTVTGNEIGLNRRVIGGNVTYKNVNTPVGAVACKNMSIGGYVFINSAQENCPQSFAVINSSVGGNFTFLGGNNGDLIPKNVSFAPPQQYVAMCTRA